MARDGMSVESALTDSRSVEEAEDMPLPTDPRTIFLGGLFLIAVVSVLSIAHEVILPVLTALVLKLLLQPLVRVQERIGIPKALAALVAVIVLLGVFGALGAILSSPASNMVRNFPELVEKARTQFQGLESWTDRIGSFMGLKLQSPAELLKINPGDLAGTLAGSAGSFASHLLETLLIMYYMLVFGETFMLRLVEVLPRFRDKKQAVGISTAVERDISAYLLTITIINAVVGVLTGLVMWLFGVPGALLWGVIAFCLNYVPILGPFAGVALFALVGLATLGASWTALAPAALYLAIHFAEGEAITPMLLAKRFTLNPIAVMIGLVFWYWLWGVQGAILAVPLLAVMKIVSDRVRPLRAVGHLLEG